MSQQALTTENMICSAVNVILDTVSGAVVSYITGGIAEKFVPINKGWFKPQKIFSSFMGNYARRSDLQSLVQAGLTIASNIMANILNFAKSAYQKPENEFFDE